MKLTKIVLTLVILILLTSVALAQGGYDLSWWTVDGGGYIFSHAGEYTLGGTIGQPDASNLSGGDYTLVGGFWGSEIQAGSSDNRLIHLPIIMKNN